MNKQSVAHSYVQNQQPSSWIDDPFQLGTHAFKGLKPMNHKQELCNYADELVGQYAKYSDDQYELTLYMLPEDDQNELVRWYIESIDREIEWACYGDDESINSSFLCALISMLKDDSKESRDNFAEVTRKNILIHYKDTLNELLATACDNYLHLQMNEQGLYPSQDMDNGDVVWGKF